MKNLLKPFLVVIMALCLILAMAACGDNEGETTDAIVRSDEEIETSKKEGSSAEKETFPGLQEGGTLAESGWSGLATEFDTSPT